MSEFALFKTVLEDYNRDKVLDKVDNNVFSCCHENLIEEKGISCCIDCGQEMQHKMQHDKEWRYYGQSDSKHSSDPNRVQMRKVEEKGIYKDVENLAFTDSIIHEANKLYSEVTNGRILRGSSRKSIVFACVFHSLKIHGKPQTLECLIKIFNLDRKTALKGLKTVNLNAPKNSKIRTTYITPINLIEEIMDIFSANTQQKKEVIDLYLKIKNRSSKLNRSRPQSVASAVVYYWSYNNTNNISLKDFAKKVALSELTINKIFKEIEQILEH